MDQSISCHRGAICFRYRFISSKLIAQHPAKGHTIVVVLLSQSRYVDNAGNGIAFSSRASETRKHCFAGREAARASQAMSRSSLERRSG